MRASFVLAAVCGLAVPGSAVADTYSYYYYSLEALTDASDSVVEATVVASPYTGNPSGSTITVKAVGRVLKQVGNAGPAEGAVMPCHVAGGKAGHRVLLFTRPDVKKPGGRVAYCVYLTADARPEAKTGDPFGLLPNHTSGFGPLEFNIDTCVAIDRAGRVLTDPAAVVRLVETRIKDDPKRVFNEVRDVPCGPKVDDGDDHHLYVPAGPQPK